MKGQAGTLFMYLVWAVFFGMVAYALYNAVQTTVVTGVSLSPSDVVEMVKEARKMSYVGGGEVCRETVVKGGTIIRKEWVREVAGVDVSFECRGSMVRCNGEMEFRGTARGIFCVECQKDKCTLKWR